MALTDIAHEAAKKNMQTLAKELLVHESSITRKIPVLVWMKDYDTSLKEALNGNDSNLIYLVLLKFFDTENDLSKRKALYKNIINNPNKA